MWILMMKPKPAARFIKQGDEEKMENATEENQARFKRNWGLYG